MTAVPIGYVASLEQHEPAAAVQYAARAAGAGFEGVVAGDHFQPALPQQGQAGFMWSVLAAMGAQTRGRLGGVTTPGYRMHPAVVAQAAATLACLYPNRHWLALGSGEALSEHVIGEYWPEPPERIARMFEALEIIKKLFSGRGKDVRYHGQHYRLESSRLWTMPPTPPPILIATSGPATARRAGRSADGLLTVEPSARRLQLLLDRFDQGTRESGRDPSHLVKAIQVRVSWAETQQAAGAQAMDDWPVGGVRFPTADIRSPFVLAQAAKTVRLEDLTDRVLVSADPQAHRDHLQRYADLGFTHLYVQHVGRSQADFIDAYAEHVIGQVNR